MNQETRRPPVFSASRRVLPGAPVVVPPTQPSTPIPEPAIALPPVLPAISRRPVFGRSATVVAQPAPRPAPVAQVLAEAPAVATPEVLGAVQDSGAQEAPPVVAPRPRFGSGRSTIAQSSDGPSGIDFDEDGPPGAAAVPLERGIPGERLSAGVRPRFGSSSQASAAPVAGLNTEGIVGRLDNLRTINDWAVGSIWNDDRRQMKITGTGLSDLTEGLEYLFVGYTKNHPQHGESLEVVAVTPHISPKPMAIAHFIAGSYKGIGIAKADQFVKAVKAEKGDPGLEELRLQLINDPFSVDLSSLADGAVYSPKGAGADGGIEMGLGRQSAVYRDLATRLGGVPGMKASVLKSLAAWLVAKNGPYQGAQVPVDLPQRCWALLAHDPYVPMAEVDGYAWLSAEAIGRVVGVPRDLPRRLSALTQHALGLGCANGGHAFLLPGDLHAAVLKLDPRLDPEGAVAQAVKDGFIVFDEKGRAYRPEILQAETRLAQGIAELLVPGKPLVQSGKSVLDAKIAEMAKLLGFDKGLDPSQLDAVSRILRSPVRIHTLVGGPGCGKTTVMEVLAKMLPGKEIVFATPTGKSAKVLHARVSKHGLSVATLHSTLGCRGEGDFFHGPEEPLDADGFVIDESSMPDIVLSDAAVAALASGAHLVLVGDPDQLESIGPGRVLKDILQIEGVDHNRLSTTHRNGGAILALVNSCRSGSIGLDDGDGVWFSRTLEDASVQMGEVSAAYMAAVERVGFSNVMLMMSRRKGDAENPGWNTTYANAVLREMCNPHAKKIAGSSFHVGDRVIIRERIILEQRGPDGEPGGRTETVVNGDVGTIRDVLDSRRKSGPRSLLPQWVDIDLDDGRTINLPGANLSSLGHAYALTVHSAQGSEYKEVILVATPGQASFVNRSMLLTGLSRARADIKVFANDGDLRKIAATPTPERNSALVERVYAAGAGEGDGQPRDDRMRV